MTDLLSLAKDVLSKAGIAFDRLAIVHMNRSPHNGTSLSLLVFVDGQRLPRVFIKATPDSEIATLFKHEFNNLSRLHECGSRKLRKAVPQALYYGKSNAFTVLAQTVQPGAGMKSFPPDTYFQSKRFRRHFSGVVRWAYEFYAGFGDRPMKLQPRDITSRLLIPVDNYRRAFHTSSELDDLLAETVKQLKNSEIPMAPRHGDFCAENILVDASDQISVIDWEYPLVKTWPLCDLLYFISSIWCIPYGKGRHALVENYKQLFFGRTRFTELIRESVGWYLRQLSVKREFILPLSVMAWVLYAHQKLEYLNRSTHCMNAYKLERNTLPLIMLEHNSCLNLEILAENRAAYVLTSP